MRGRTFVFGSSGLLFRSNKLMYDRQTKSLWNHLRGEPVVGPLADSGIRLAVRPITTLPWREWLRLHPDTLVLDMETGHERDYTPGRPYGTYFASPDTMFPVSPRSPRLATKAWVFVLRLPGAAKVYPLEAFEREILVHDRVGDTDVLALGRPESRTVRAFAREGLRFSAEPAGTLVDGAGTRWAVREEALVQDGTGRRLPRLGGHLAYWFGWFAFHPDTPVYGR